MARVNFLRPAPLRSVPLSVILPSAYSCMYLLEYLNFTLLGLPWTVPSGYWMPTTSADLDFSGMRPYSTQNLRTMSFLACRSLDSVKAMASFGDQYMYVVLSCAL